MCVLVYGGLSKASGVHRLAYQLELHSRMVQILEQCEHIPPAIQLFCTAKDRDCGMWSMALTVFSPDSDKTHRNLSLL